MIQKPVRKSFIDFALTCLKSYLTGSYFMHNLSSYNLETYLIASTMLYAVPQKSPFKGKNYNFARSNSFLITTYELFIMVVILPS